MSSLSDPRTATATQFRENVMAVLEQALPMPVVAGRIDGAQKRRAVCCVFPVQRSRVETNKLHENFALGVRCWLLWRDPKDPDRPVDPTAIEELSETLLRTMSANQVSLGPWFIDVTSVTFDPEAQSVEMIVVGTQDNPFAMCEEG